MGLLDLLGSSKVKKLEEIASLTHHNNTGMRQTIESVNPEDIDLSTLEETANNLRLSEKALRSITGENSQ